jgi:hypothetical protein
VAFALYREPTLFWFSLAALLIVWLAVRGARIAAVEWGDVVKASFDVFTHIPHPLPGLSSIFFST